MPTETADVVRSFFNIDNVYLSIGDQVDDLFRDLNLGDLDAMGGKRPGSLCLLAMVTVFQYAEDLPDRLAAEAVRKRTDWKYALHLSLDYPYFNPIALCEFRQQILLNKEGQQVFQCMLKRLTEIGLLNHRVKNWTGAGDVLMSVCTLSRVDQLVQAMTLALEALAATHPELLRGVTLPHWYKRYSQPAPTINLPNSKGDQKVLVQAIGEDTSYLLETVSTGDEPGPAQLPEVRSLRRTWQQQFEQEASEFRWCKYCSFCQGTTLPSRLQRQGGDSS